MNYPEMYIDVLEEFAVFQPDPNRAFTSVLGLRLMRNPEVRSRSKATWCVTHPRKMREYKKRYNEKVRREIRALRDARKLNPCP